MHEIKVKEKYYNKIKLGEKIYEVRLLDEKRKLIKKGDLIKIFKEPELNEFLIAEVEDLVCFKTFNQMASTLTAKEIGFEGCLPNEIVNEYYRFYTKESEEQFGVVAIKVKVKLVVLNQNTNNKLTLMPSWYWIRGLHDAVIKSVKIIDFNDGDYKNCLHLEINSVKALRDNTIKAINFYNFECQNLQALTNGWWYADQLEYDGNMFKLTIVLERVVEKQKVVVIFETAEVKR